MRLRRKARKLVTRTVAFGLALVVGLGSPVSALQVKAEEEGQIASTVSIDAVTYKSQTAWEDVTGAVPAKDQYPKPEGDPYEYNVVPNELQYEYMKDELAAFCHFGPNTFNNIEWGEHYGDRLPSDIFPLGKGAFDPKPMIQKLKEAGFTKLVVTAKHHDGFCIWYSNYTTYDAEEAGADDVLTKLSEACTEYDMDMGLYLSPWDIHDKSYGYYNESGQPLVDNKGNPTNGKTFDEHYKLEGDALDYNEYYNNQLEEILSNPQYGNAGKFKEVWMDGAKGSGTGVQYYDFKKWFETIKKYEGEDCMLFGAEAYTTVRWIGNEGGYANEETWGKSTVNYANNTINSYRTGAQNTYIGSKSGNQWTVPEVDCRITSGWFWGPNKRAPKTLSQLGDFYFNSVGHNGVLLLNIPPNNGATGEGSVDTAILDRIEEFGNALKATFGENGYGRGAYKNEETKGIVNNRNLLKGATVYADSVRNNSKDFGPANILDNNQETYWTVDDNQYEGKLYVKLPESKLIDIISLEEGIQFGQRITGFTVEYRNGDSDSWSVFATGTTIGAKRLIRGAAVRADQLRITVSTGTKHDHYGNPAIDIPVLTEIGAYKAVPAFESGTKIPNGMEYIDCRQFTKDDNSKWKDEGGNHFVGSTSMFSTKGSTTTAQFTFTGSKVYLYGTKDPGHGSAEIYIDGKLVDTINTAVAPRTTGTLIYESADMTHKTHTMQIKALGTPVAVDGAYIVANKGRGMINLESKSYTMYEASTLDVKILRTGGYQGVISGVLEPNPGSAIQDDFDTTPIPFVIPANVEEITVQVKTRRNSNATGDQDFSIELTRGTAEGSTGYIIGFNDIATITIKDTESVDTEELNSLIAEVNDLNPVAYTSISYAKLRVAFTEAQAALESGDNQRKLVALDNLRTAKNSLVLLSAPEKEPFMFPNEEGQSVELEAETGTLENYMAGSTETWKLAVENGNWASGGKYINSFNSQDKVIFSYYAEYAGIYKFTATYRSGSTSNALEWVEPSGKIISGRVVAGDDTKATTNRTVEFNINVVTPGRGYLTFVAPATNSPQLDKFNIEFLEKAAVTVVESFETIEETVDAGILPLLPGRVTAIMSDGTTRDFPVDWSDLTEDKIAKPGTYYIYGIAEGADKNPVAIITVSGIVAVNNVRVYTVVGKAPTLPDTIEARRNDDSTVMVPVEWENLESIDFNESDTVVSVTGTVSTEGYTGQVVAFVSVKGTGNSEEGEVLSLNTSPGDNSLPVAFANYFRGNDKPIHAVNGKTDYTDWIAGSKKTAWNDWASGTYHTENNWLGVVLDNGAGRSVVNQADIWWLDEGNDKAGRVTVPKSYMIEYYVGPELKTTDYDVNNQASAWSGAVANSPLKNDANWLEVTYIEGGKPDLPEYEETFNSENAENWQQVQTVIFEPVITQAIRVKVEPHPSCWVGIYEFDVRGKHMETSSSVDPEQVSFTIGDNDAVISEVTEGGIRIINVDLSEGRDMPTIAATHGDPTVMVTVIPTTDRNGTTRVLFTSEDGSSTIEYQIRFTDSTESLVTLGEISWNYMPIVGEHFDINNPRIASRVPITSQTWEIKREEDEQWREINLKEVLVDKLHNNASLRYKVTYQVGAEEQAVYSNELIVAMDLSHSYIPENNKVSIGSIKFNSSPTAGAILDIDEPTIRSQISMVDQSWQILLYDTTEWMDFNIHEEPVMNLLYGAKVRYMVRYFDNGTLVEAYSNVLVVNFELGEEEGEAPEGFAPVINNPSLGEDSLGSDRVVYDTDFAYSGQNITPAIEIWDHGVKLTPGVDYTLSYKNNKNAWVDKEEQRFADITGSYEPGKNNSKRPTIIVTGKGSYTKKQTIFFNIVPFNIENLVNANKVLVKISSKNPVPVIYDNGTKLKEKKDFTVIYEDGKAVVTGIGNYSGTIEYTVLDKGALVDVNKLKINIDTKGIIYDGKAVDLHSLSKIKVLNGKEELKNKTHYTTEYVGNAKAGKASVTIIGVPENGYVGSVTKVFNITGKDLKNDILKGVKLGSETFRGIDYPITLSRMSESNRKKFEVSITYGSKNIALTEGINGHYTVNYKNNNKLGTATATLKGTGKDGITGTVSLTYKIVAPDASHIETVIENASAVEYVKGGAMPEVKLEYTNDAGKTVKLLKGVDYTLVYNKPSAGKKITTVGATAAEISFKGNYAGLAKKYVPYTVVAKDLGKVTMLVADLEAGKSYKSAPKTVLTDISGKNLTVKTDYTLKYSTDGGTTWSDSFTAKLDNLSKEAYAGKIQVKAIATDTDTAAYTGEQVFTVHIGDKGRAISSTKVSKLVKAYTGRPILLEAEEANMLLSIKVGSGYETVEFVGNIENGLATIGLDENKKDQDGYYIVSYNKNVAKGKMSVVVRGNGAYYGNKTITLSISARTMDNMNQSSLFSDKLNAILDFIRQL